VRRAAGRLVVTAPPAAPEPDGDGGTRTIHLVIGAAQPPVSEPPLEFRAFDRSTLSADGRSVNVGELACHRAAGPCADVAVQLSARWTELHDVASTARASQRLRLVVFGRAVLTVPALGRRAVRVPVGPAVRRVLAAGRTVHAVAAARATADAEPLVRRVALRGR
jgi:hypothetical protein